MRGRRFKVLACVERGDEGVYWRWKRQEDPLPRCRRLRQIADHVFSAQRAQKTTTFEFDEFSLLLQFVQRGFGLAMVPRALIQDSQIVALDVTLRDSRFPTWELGMYSARQPEGLPANPVAQKFRDMVMRSVGT